METVGSQRDDSAHEDGIHSQHVVIGISLQTSTFKDNKHVPKCKLRGKAYPANDENRMTAKIT